MKSFLEINATLRRKNISQYGLLAGCCFFSVLLISAYVTMMRSPTVLTVLPEGGDSRKQMMMIFVLAVIGCGVFTTYASGLFFRYKSREVGTFLALGATKRSIRKILSRELLLISTVSCALGILLGTPLAYALWQGFRVLVVDSQEMKFVFEPQAMLFGLAFSVFVFIMLFFMLARFLKRTNILDVINEARKSETVHLVPRYFGWLGIVLIIIGCFLGYQMPSVFILGLQWYPPGWLTAIFYLPALAGLYMILLHTVVNGWSKKRNRYKSIISSSMMKFQGRQTVRNMVVVALLVAGAFFGSFYTPLLATSSTYEFETRTMDYLFHYRSDQNLPEEDEIRQLAEKMNVTITKYNSVPAAALGVDGEEHVEKQGTMGTTYEKVYREVLNSDIFISESSYNALTGQKVDIVPGFVAAVFNNDGQGVGMMGNNVELITNIITGEKFPVTSQEQVLCNNQLFGRRVLDDGDFNRMTAGLPDDWREQIVSFNVEDVMNTYYFSKALYHEIVHRSGPEVEVIDAWDPVGKLQAEQAGEEYSFDVKGLIENNIPLIQYENLDSSDFRLYWKYMPQFRVLDELEMFKMMAVFLILFIFIAILCFVAVMVILFTRSMTIALTNRQVYEDLSKLGASKRYLYGTIKKQISSIFVAPIATGTGIIAIFYTMILYFNDNMFSKAEMLSAVNCVLIVAGVMALFYILYRITLVRVCRSLGVMLK